MNTIEQMKEFIENAQPLTNWHQTMFTTALQLHNWTAKEGNGCILLSDNNHTITINN